MGWGPAIAGVATLCWDIVFPVFIGFQGGRGSSPVQRLRFLSFSPFVFLISLQHFGLLIVTIATSRFYVSLGSVLESCYLLSVAWFSS